MILSRVADALYWMGRYLERAENATRLLLVTEELSTEVLGLDEDLARAEWESLAEIFPGQADPERGTPSERPDRLPRPGTLAASSLAALSLSASHPSSVHFSLKKARDNARTVREALTVEVFVNLNETYQDLEAQAKRKITDPTTFRAALSEAQRGILATVGAIESTLTRDPSWLFLKLGESMERVFRTATVLRVKLPGLIDPEPKLDLPLVYTRWRGLLRGLSSLENYRQVSGARIEPLEMLHFLLFNPHAPRSLHSGVGAVKDGLDRLSNGVTLTPPARLIGKLAAALAYQEDEVVARGTYVPFLEHVLAEVGKTHDALSTLYFGS
jgi:uncharacterized alpha-E superfamily protein